MGDDTPAVGVYRDPEGRDLRVLLDGEPLTPVQTVHADAIVWGDLDGDGESVTIDDQPSAAYDDGDSQWYLDKEREDDEGRTILSPSVTVVPDDNFPEIAVEYLDDVEEPEVTA